MPCHIWGDEWFEQNGSNLASAERYIRGFVKHWSGCYLSSKEKYGTIRYEHVFPPMQYPANSRLKQYIYYKWTKFGVWILSIAIKKATKKWPHIKEEILDDWDPEWF